MNSNTSIGFRIVCLCRLDTRLYSISGIASTAYGRPQAKIANSSYVITQVHFSIFLAEFIEKSACFWLLRDIFP